MRIEWNPGKYTQEIETAAMDRLAELGKKVAERARQICPVGVDVPKGAGKWSGRRAGALRDTIRMTRLKGDPKLNIRVYAGNDTDVFYARFVEHGWHDRKGVFRKKPFLRPAFHQVKGLAKSIMSGE